MYCPANFNWVKNAKMTAITAVRKRKFVKDALVAVAFLVDLQCRNWVATIAASDATSVWQKNNHALVGALNVSTKYAVTSMLSEPGNRG